ncbi:MAG TPA: hypothetical protein VFF29_01105, partial [Bacteroidota bacterium]|nr:hypothetical protein [Bacteroidota bacterium]
MRKLFMFLICFFFIIDIASSQTKARSKTGSIGFREGPAVLTATIEFVEPSGNTFLDGSETGTIKIVVSNTGGSDAKSVIAKLTTSSPVTGVTFPSSIPIGNIGRGTSAEGHFDLSAAENVKTMSMKFKVEASDDSGIKIEPKTITVLTKE